MDIRLNGQVAIVTGSASGIGRGIAEGLADSGAYLAIVDIDGAGARRQAELITDRFGVKSIAIETDVSDSGSVEAMAAAVTGELGGIDILVNNAGIAPAHPLVDFPIELWDKAIAINMTGYFLCARAVAKVMIEQGRGGSIINLSSKSGVRGSAQNSPYNASKSGVIGLGQGWCRELAQYGIRVNSVLPGNVLRGSGIWSPEYINACAEKLGIRPEEVEDHYNRQVPLGRQCTVEDIANLVVFLVSDKAGYITGTSMLVDGGQEMR